MSTRQTIFILVFGLIFAGAVQDKVGLPTDLSAIAVLAPAEASAAQVGSSISADGTAPNDNAMLDVQSPATGDGKGILIPRLTGNQRTNANASLAGGLLDDSGDLRGGAAQGLIVYQTDGNQGLYFNTSQIATPAWVYLGSSTTNYLPLTGGTMSGALNMGAQVITNVSHIDFNGIEVSVGRGANGSDYGAAVGRAANGSDFGAAMGAWANGYSYGAVVGYVANGTNHGAALGYFANGSGRGVAVGASATGTNFGAAVGYQANGSDKGAAVGYQANGSDKGAAMGYLADGYSYGVAVGASARGTNHGAAVGYFANGSSNGAAVGYLADGSSFGVAVGSYARGRTNGVAVGYKASGGLTNVAIGMQANAHGGGQGMERIAIGHNVTNEINNTAVIRGTLYLDGGTGIVCRTTFGDGAWAAKAFEINHPLDPENKILRHFCMEGPQVWNVYAGNAQLVDGFAVVELPDYYSALNLVGSEIYSLTPIGEALVWVDNEVSDNCFVIAGKRDLKVSWTIKVLRNDPGCLEDLQRRPVEQLKRDLAR